MLLAGILMLALSRAEMVERFQTPPITMVNGLVKVFADCPRDMRREFHSPIAKFASGICQKLELKERMKEPRFDEPGIVIYVGDVRTNRSDLVVRRQTRESGSKVTKIYLPAPAFADVERFRLEVVKAFYYAAEGKELDDDGALAALVASDPQLKIDDEYARLAEWLAGEGPHDIFADADPSALDEEYLRLMRTVIQPGTARRDDVLRFASRLRIYPRTFGSPIAGRFRDCSFADAIDLVAVDPRIRIFAYDKAPLVVAYGGGRSEELTSAAVAYSEFLLDLMRNKKSKEELKAQLEDADMLLNIALERAREDELRGRWR